VRKNDFYIGDNGKLERNIAMLLKKIKDIIEKYFYLDCTISRGICSPNDNFWIDDAIMNEDLFKVRKYDWKRGEILPHVICCSGSHAGKIARVNKRYIKLINN